MTDSVSSSAPAARHDLWPASGTTISQASLDALQWQVAWWSGELSAEERQAFDTWLAADAAHQHAWSHVQGIGRELAAVPGAIAGPALRAALPPRGGNARRNVLRGMCLLAGGAASAYLLRESGQWAALNADYRSARGERQDLTLPDGTRLSLNTASAVDLRFNERERRVLLRSGEVLITTSADQAPVHRPFIVQTDEGSVQALGTQFLLRRLEDASPALTSVQVFDGAVDIVPVSGSVPLRLKAGQQARFSRSDVQAPAIADPQDAAWRQGLLVAERQRLGDFLAELSRYRAGVLRCDPAVADLLVSGVYPLQDIDKVLASLAQALPIRVHRMTRYWVTVAAA
ncbi:FecR domain-containing protein [Pusillimonas sp. SM2304]|uniref:FecR domain-containing protein n=1 Tax=Pusillimonas sp. SM2304 TaxID=3073241 RepID=UPI0028762268|nr:FecR domain-containing protein [Pusillimonas sp. SM2304]MDS1139476.1 FecR domain-containing protein [Pusillimonas sp. SM2304]